MNASSLNIYFTVMHSFVKSLCLRMLQVSISNPQKYSMDSTVSIFISYMSMDATSIDFFLRRSMNAPSFNFSSHCAAWLGENIMSMGAPSLNFNSTVMRILVKSSLTQGIPMVA